MAADDVEIDEAAYLRMYPDVARAVSSGKIRSAREHYLRFGRVEGRVASPSDLKGVRRTLCFGAYGTNNVGDEAIFGGLSYSFENAVQLYINKSSIENSMYFLDVMSDEKFFRKDDHLVLGGGGLFYGPEPIQHMTQLAISAKKAGSRVSLLGIGCEGFKSEYRDLILRLLDTVVDVTVRSERSKAIMMDNFGINPAVQPDFAYQLAPRVGRAYGSNIGGPLRIGIVTGGDVRVDYSELSKLIQLNSMNNMRYDRKIEFMFIPHSNAYVDRFNNDSVVGHALWSSINIYHPGREDCFSIAGFDSNPLSVLDLYRTLDGIITARFHGMIFGDIVGIPILCLAANTSKNKSFIEGNPRLHVFGVEDQKNLVAEFDQFKAHCLDIRARKERHIEEWYVKSR